MKFIARVKSIIRLDKKTLLKKIGRAVHNFIYGTCDLYADTRTDKAQAPVRRSFIAADDIDSSTIPGDVIDYHVAMFTSHRFDVLGSGWVGVGYDAKPAGFEDRIYDNPAAAYFTQDKYSILKKTLRRKHLKSGEEIINQLPDDYQLIDWQRDIKSGYRWDARKWYKDQRIAPVSGADIKVPWELSRMQHLLQSAIFTLARPSLKSTLLREFRNEVFDFIASNPPRMGVNWTCTMDVSIRAVNLLMAYDIFSQIDDDGILDDAFAKVFSASMYEHGVHIVENLEYHRDRVHNHYLSNVAGLLFVASYLERDHETVEWQAFAALELVRQCRRQFFDDGANFEGSTSYHRLSGEMIVYSSALLMGLNESEKSFICGFEPKKIGNKNLSKIVADWDDASQVNDLLPDWYLQKLYKIGLFSLAITKPNGNVPQIGDNDSGRFIKLTPNGFFSPSDTAKLKYANLRHYEPQEPLYWMENNLSHENMLSAISGICACDTFKLHAEKFPCESSLISSMSGRKFPIVVAAGDPKEPVSASGRQSLALQHHSTTTFHPQREGGPSLYEGGNFHYFETFGLYVLKSERVYLAVSLRTERCRTIDGHLHGDQLSFELMIDDDDIVLDPGTYIYTPLPKLRNSFRNESAHHTISVYGMGEGTESENEQSIFGAISGPRVSITGVSGRGIEAIAEGRGYTHLRSFAVSPDSVVIKDSCDLPFHTSINTFPMYSCGYGYLTVTDKF